MTKEERIDSYNKYIGKLHLLGQSAQIKNLFKTVNFAEGLFEVRISMLAKMNNFPKELHIPSFVTSISTDPILTMESMETIFEPVDIARNLDLIHHIYLPSSIELTPSLQIFLQENFNNLEGIHLEVAARPQIEDKCITENQQDKSNLSLEDYYITATWKVTGTVYLTAFSEAAALQKAQSISSIAEISEAKIIACESVESVTPDTEPFRTFIFADYFVTVRKEDQHLARSILEDRLRRIRGPAENITEELDLDEQEEYLFNGLKEANIYYEKEYIEYIE